MGIRRTRNMGTMDGSGILMMHSDLAFLNDGSCIFAAHLIMGGRSSLNAGDCDYAWEVVYHRIGTCTTLR